MAIYSVLVAKSSKNNFLDGISNEIWGFTSENKLFPKEQKKVEVGDFITFGYAIHQASTVDKGSFPRVKALEEYLNHYQPYVELLTLCQITEVISEPDHRPVLDVNKNEIWVHRESTTNAHKFPYRVKLKTIKTYNMFDFIKERLSRDIVEAFRRSSASVGSLQLASLSDDQLTSLTKDYELPSLTPESTNKLINIESGTNFKHLRKGTKEYTAYRNENRLVQEYCSYIEKSGTSSVHVRNQITMPNGKNLFTDITIGNKIIEAKSDSTRNSVRTAIGQLYDYEFLLNNDYKKAILLPNIPEESLCNLIKKLGFSIIYKSNSTFIEFNC